MKLTYSIEKSTSAKVPALINEAFFFLKELDYSITSNKDNIITFKFKNDLKLVPRGQNMNVIDNGKFTFTEHIEEVVIKLTYSISIMLPIIVIPILLIAGIFESPIMFIAIGAFCISLISFFVKKTKAEGMINEIISRVKK